MYLESVETCRAITAQYEIKTRRDIPGYRQRKGNDQARIKKNRGLFRNSLNVTLVGKHLNKARGQDS